AHRRMQRRQEGKSQQAAADHPHAGEYGRKRIDAARGPALLDRLQDLADGLAVVIGGATRLPDVLDRLKACSIGVRARLEARLVEGRRRGHDHRARRCVDVRRGEGTVGRGIVDVQSFLNGRKRDFRRVFDLLGGVRHVQSEPSLYSRDRVRRERPRRLEIGIYARCGVKARPPAGLSTTLPTSYWLNEPKGMAPINTILIIVNSISP